MNTMQEIKALALKEIKAILPKGWKVTMSAKGRTMRATVTTPFLVASEVKPTFDEVRSCFKRDTPLALRYDDRLSYFVRRPENVFCNPEYNAVIDSIFSIMSKGNWDNSDVMTDYFDFGWITEIYIKSDKKALENADFGRIEYRHTGQGFDVEQKVFDRSGVEVSSEIQRFAMN